MESGKIISINISKRKGTRKENVGEAFCVEDYGLKGDAHAGNGIRQVSLLSAGSIEKMRQKGLSVDAGDFAENITVGGLNLLSFLIGQKFKAGEAVLELSQIGKECHTKCAIYYKAGDCVMPKEGIFARVIKSGTIKVGDKIEAILSATGGKDD